MHLTVCPIRGLGSIPSRGGEFHAIAALAIAALAIAALAIAALASAALAIAALAIAALAIAALAIAALAIAALAIAYFHSCFWKPQSAILQRYYRSYGVAFFATELGFHRFHLLTYNDSRIAHFGSVLLVIQCTIWVQIYEYV